MRRSKTDPRIIRSSFPTTCQETGWTIQRGDECVYYPNGRVYHMDSKQAQEYREWRADIDQGFNY